jgi:uncharacterized repeat protein (TIGR01451 family)
MNRFKSEVSQSKGVMMARHFPLVLTAALMLSAMTPGLAMAQTNGLALDSVVELERSETAADGTVTTRYSKPDVVLPGDRVRITLSYNNRGREPVTDLKLRNPIPNGLQFDGTNDLAGLSMSIDGGTSWGQLADLKLTAADGTERAAVMTDITHVMWVLEQPVPPGGSGSVSFFTRVR